MPTVVSAVRTVLLEDPRRDAAGTEVCHVSAFPLRTNATLRFGSTEGPGALEVSACPPVLLPPPESSDGRWLANLPAGPEGHAIVSVCLLASRT